MEWMSAGRNSDPASNEEQGVGGIRGKAAASGNGTLPNQPVTQGCACVIM